MKVYSDSGLKVKTGLKIYSSKPYLLVKRRNQQEPPLDISIVYLPDLQNPQYLRHRAGLGSSKLTVEVNDSGFLQKYSLDTDTKIPDTIEAIGTVVSSTGSALDNLLGALGAKEEKEPAVFELYEIRQTRDGTFLVPVEIKASGEFALPGE